MEEDRESRGCWTEHEDLGKREGKKIRWGKSGRGSGNEEMRVKTS